MIPAVALSSLRMDKGENLKYAYGTVKRMTAQRPEWYAFDIICNTNQLREANRILPIIEAHIKKHNPQLDDEHLGVGVTIDFYQRPGAEKIFKRMMQLGYDFSDVPMVDINPDREEHWTEQ